MIGVNFQPGAQETGQANGQARPGGGGVQEAIKILSLRLPRVLGAQGATPMPLLTSQGSGGNPRVDSVVNQVLSRVMGGQPQGGGPTAPMLPSAAGSSPSAPSFTGGAAIPPPMPGPRPQPPVQQPRGVPMPRVVVDSPFSQPPRWPGQAQLDGGGPPPALIGELPPDFQFPAPPPSPVPPWGDVGFGLGGNQGGGSGQRRSPFDQPLF